MAHGDHKKYVILQSVLNTHYSMIYDDLLHNFDRRKVEK